MTNDDSPRYGHAYTDVAISGSARVHFGDNYNNYNSAGSKDQTIYRAIIDSLAFDGIGRRSRILSTETRESFEWILGRDEQDGELGSEGTSVLGRELEASMHRYLSGSPPSTPSPSTPVFTPIRESHKQQNIFEELLATPQRSHHRDAQHSLEKDGFLQSWEERRRLSILLENWLSSDQQSSMFWITGKPGSGKSTLAKAIQDHEHLDLLLRKWTEGSDYVIVEHYFWLAGDRMQRSLVGMLQGLLYGILEALTVEADLMTLRTICDTRWATRRRHHQWNYRALKASLLRACKCANLKILFIIDGLDECGTEDHATLAADIMEFGVGDNVKSLLTSRPRPAFQEIMRNAPQIRLEDITSLDMRQFALERLAGAESSQNSSCDFRDQSLEALSLVSDVILRAEGVFLWTSLIIKALTTEIRKGCSIQSLSNLVRDYPEGLEQYFRDRIYARVPQTRQNRIDTANALILLINTQQGVLPRYNGGNLVAFSLLSRNQLFTSLPLSDLNSSTQEEALRWKHQATLFLQETCGDLVQVSSWSGQLLKKQGSFTSSVDSPLTCTVDFVHRSAFDFLHNEQTMSFIKANCSDEFSQSDFADRIDLACLREMIGHEDIRCSDATSILLEMMVTYERRREEWQLQLLHECDARAAQRIAQTCNTHTSAFMQSHDHWNIDISTKIFSTSLRQYALEVMRRLPCMVFQGRRLHHEQSDLEVWLGLDIELTQVENLDVSCLQQLLDSGSHPNGAVTKHVIVTNSACLPTRPSIWEQFLYKWIIRYAEAVKANLAPAASTENEDTIAEIALAMLDAGADPGCKLCVCLNRSQQDHLCQRIPLEQAIETYLPARWHEEALLKLKHASDSATKEYRSKRQRLRALRSFRSALPVPDSTSYIPFMTTKFATFLQWWTSTMSPAHSHCSLCGYLDPGAGFHLCLDCVGTSLFCTDCIHNSHCRSLKGHSFLDYVGSFWTGTSTDGPWVMRDWKSLHAVCVMLNEWYDRNAETYGVLRPDRTVEDGQASTQRKRKRSVSLDDVN